eukprot:TRINITY_DN14360_c0_g1_i3.p1 TRINITY_DN14360_c0_g1~~TRINITY_DN14360_c0_g1_i3.p1  ORF type:complete len:266 (-),score=73.36 TRINITY_DN14360_c0_g1_i3:74-871(-)
MINDLNSQLNDKYEEIDDLTKDKQAVEDECNKLKEKLVGVEADIDTLQRLLDEKSKENDYLARKCEDKSKELNQLNDITIPELNKEVESLKDKLKEAEQSKDDCMRAIKLKEDGCARHEGKIKRLTNTNKDLKDQLNKLQEQANAQEPVSPEEIANLKEDIKEFKRKLRDKDKEFAGKYGSLEAEYAKQQRELHDLRQPKQTPELEPIIEESKSKKPIKHDIGVEAAETLTVIPQAENLQHSLSMTATLIVFLLAKIRFCCSLLE